MVEMRQAVIHLIAMELIYPINLVGFDYAAGTGEVITRDGEFIGYWTFHADEDQDVGRIDFVPLGHKDVLVAEDMSVLDSGLHVGMALSKLGRAIREWHESETGHAI